MGTLAFFAGGNNPTGQTILLKKVLLRKLEFFIFSRSLPSGLISLLSNAVVVCRPFSSFPLVVCRPISHAVIVRHCRHPPLPLSSFPTIDVHRCHDPPLQPSLPLRVSAVSCRPPLSIPFAVRHPILHAIVVRHCRCPPSPSLSAAAIFHCCSHHHHSAVSAVSHHPLSSFSIPVRRPITHVIILICHHCHPPPLLSAITVPPLVLPPTRCWLFFL